MKYRRSDAKDFARANMNGIWAAALMPFAEDFSIDEKGFRKNLRHWIDDLELVQDLAATSAVGGKQPASSNGLMMRGRRRSRSM